MQNVCAATRLRERGEKKLRGGKITNDRVHLPCHNFIFKSTRQTNKIVEVLSTMYKSNYARNRKCCI